MSSSTAIAPALLVMAHVLHRSFRPPSVVPGFCRLVRALAHTLLAEVAPHREGERPFGWLG
eukprot:9003562-Alexandrium_andersonii.AAC.1